MKLLSIFSLLVLSWTVPVAAMAADGPAHDPMIEVGGLELVPTDQFLEDGRRIHYAVVDVAAYDPGADLEDPGHFTGSKQELGALVTWGVRTSFPHVLSGSVAVIVGLKDATPGLLNMSEIVGVMVQAEKGLGAESLSLGVARLFSTNVGAVMLIPWIGYDFKATYLRTNPDWGFAGNGHYAGLEGDFAMTLGSGSAKMSFGLLAKIAGDVWALPVIPTFGLGYGF